MFADPYAVLGVSRQVDGQELRRAYRRAVLRYHPDRNRSDPAATERFKQVVQAYRQLRRLHEPAPAGTPAPPTPGAAQPLGAWQGVGWQRSRRGWTGRARAFCLAHLAAVSLTTAAVLASTIAWAGVWSDARRVAEVMRARAAGAAAPQIPPGDGRPV